MVKTARRLYNACVSRLTFASLLAVLVVSPAVLRASGGSAATTEETPSEGTTSGQESEAKGIIPPNADVAGSTEVITPISTFPQKSPYEQGRDELVRALALWNSGNAEAASDLALEAYDDLSALRRVHGVKRSKLRAQTRSAAELYVEASIKTIQNFVDRAGKTEEAVDEGRERLEDLRDVAREYKKLKLMLDKAIDQVGGSPAPSAPPPK